MNRHSYPPPQRTLLKLDYHRNGISGEPFYVALFREMDERNDPDRPHTMLAIRFDSGDRELSKDYRIAVLDVEELTNGIIEFGQNSWRGDHYADTVDGWIAAWNRERFGSGDDEVNPKDNG